MNRGLETYLARIGSSFADLCPRLVAAPYRLELRQEGPLFQLHYDRRHSDIHIPFVQSCRGVVLRKADFQVVNHGFNYFRLPSGKLDEGGSFERFERKEDGTLMMVTKHNGELLFSTTGVIDASKAMVFKRGGETGNGAPASGPVTYADLFRSIWTPTALRESTTYLFELLHPLNPTVVPAERAELVLLGARRLADGQIEDPVDVAKNDFGESACLPNGIRLPYVDDDLFTVAEAVRRSRMLPWHSEGFVGVGSTRIKIRGGAFVALQRLRNGQGGRVEALQVAMTLHRERRLLNDTLCGSAGPLGTREAHIREQVAQAAASLDRFIATIHRRRGGKVRRVRTLERAIGCIRDAVCEVFVRPEELLDELGAPSR